ncbi:MAG: hypothetical protein R6U89_09535 [Dehalococcoidia bacterium]
MLTKYDELMCHQIVSTFDHVETSARQWTERVILHTHDDSGRIHMSNGFGIYRNRNIIDAFACLTVDGKTQYNVRASRELRRNPDEVAVGPFSYEVIEPLRKVRYSLAEAGYDLSYDLEFDGGMPPHEEDTQFFRVRGRVEEHVIRYDQVGRASGWIKAGGQEYKLDKSAFYVERDHSWGLRRDGVPEVGVQPGDIPEGYLYSWAVMQFPSFGAIYHIRELWDGTQILSSGGIFYPYGSGKEERRTRNIEHDFQFQEDRRKMVSGQVKLHLVDGETVEISMRPLSFACLKAGGYFGHRGFVHGQWMGEDWSDGYQLDLTDKSVLDDVSFLDNTSCELRCGDEVGYGVLELVVTGKYPRYGYQGY